MAVAWRIVHHFEPKWFAMVAASWGALFLFASVTIPIKYPYEARGQVVDSGVVIGLLVPLAVMNLALDEGPEDLIRTASRRLSGARLAVASAYLSTASAMAAFMALAAALPLRLVLADALILGSLNIIGTSLFGVRLGWSIPGAVAFTMSAPGLVPFNFNALYNREVSTAFIACVALAAVVAMVAYLRGGSTGGRRTKAVPRLRSAFNADRTDASWEDGRRMK